jgi:hypothetical protein
MGFEPTIPASEWAKTVHALDRAATVTRRILLYHLQIERKCGNNIISENEGTVWIRINDNLFNIFKNLRHNIPIYA